MTQRAFLLGLFGLVIIAAAGRALLLASGSVSFHSDEAVVALMARHILDGARPVFFYGQAYMGSLDAWLVATGFAILGESVATIRFVQSTLYLLIVLTGALAAYRLTGRAALALIVGLLLAVPNTLVALYTTATLGGYNETLLLGNLILLVGIDAVRNLADAPSRVPTDQASRGRAETHAPDIDTPLHSVTGSSSPRLRGREGQGVRGSGTLQWALLGLLAGLGWWANGLIIAFAVPIGLLLLVQAIRQRIPAAHLIVPALAAGIGFFVGSAPWWIFNLENDFAALRFYLPGGTPEQFAGGDVPALDTTQRLIGLFLLGLPAVLGLRYPWSPTYFTPDVLTLILAFAVLGITLAGLYLLARGAGVWNPRRRGAPPTDARALLLIAIAFFTLLFLLSRFSTDPTGRYFLPLIVYLAILVAGFAVSLPRTWMRAAAVGVVLLYGTLGLFAAVRDTPPGVTTQFNLDTHLPNDDDAQLIAFLETNGLHHGYTNYWIAFRIAFLSEERLQYRAALPYKPDLSYTPRDDRYTPYVEAVNAAVADGERVAYVTANIDEVRIWLEAWFAEQGITYTHATVGIYHVYYDFAPRVPVPPAQFTGILVVEQV